MACSRRLVYPLHTLGHTFLICIDSVLMCHVSLHKGNWQCNIPIAQKWCIP
uniref:Uncharacterized protein n=1 Tax=Arundo donax TaxID=35708 RepID=A0A0A9BR89_ARUDO